MKAEIRIAKAEYKTDVIISNLSKVADEMVKNFNAKKDVLIRSKIKEVLGFEIDLELEQLKRFKSLCIEYKGDEETIYYNDGSVSGKRIITFVKIENPINYNTNTFSMSTEYSYY
jgi:hypothetical protein